LGLLPRLLGACLVDVLGSLSGIREDGDLVREHLEETARDEEAVLRLPVANQHFAGSQRRQQRDVLREHAEVALDAGREHEVSLLAEHATLSRDELDLQLGHAGYSFSASVAAAAGAASAVASSGAASVEAGAGAAAEAAASAAGAASPRDAAARWTASSMVPHM